MVKIGDPQSRPPHSQVLRPTSYGTSIRSQAGNLSRLGVSRTIYVNVDSPNLGFPNLNFFGGTSEEKKNTLCKQIPPTHSTLWLVRGLWEAIFPILKPTNIDTHPIQPP